MTQTFKNFWGNPIVKVCIISVLALLMGIPLIMIRNQINDREYQHQHSLDHITDSWGHPQTFSGPYIRYDYLKETGEEKEKKTVSETLYPDDLRYEVSSAAKELHRSIYDISVYTADLTIQGNFIVDERLAAVGSGELILGMDDLKGIQGEPSFNLSGKDLKVKASSYGIMAEITLEDGTREGDVIPFQVSLKINGSESLSFKPAGRITQVEMRSDYPDPSFFGDFLPTERDIRPDGFTAKWSVSQLTMASPTDNNFGVNLVKPVTQYRQTERAAKYGILIVFLIFIAGFVVEMVSKKSINLIQYMVIGASLVLFYSLLLAFSDFLSFGLSYLIASVMTTAALGGYFAGIVKSKWAWLLTGLVALAYGIIYILLQMETFAFLAGTLLLFIILCVIMKLTKDMKLGGDV
ncbi:MAG: cell envelope integrity protein CreD [Bacteroidales bacterium]|nr:cell envelope integrity protein CreD [Bacteroidales bacterium]